MRKNRVGFLITSSSWTNFQRWHYYTSMALYERGYDVFIIAPKNNRICTKIKATKIKFIPYKNTGFILFDFLRLTFILRKNFITTLFINYPQDIVVAGFSKIFSRVSKLYFRKGTVSGIKLNKLSKLIFKNYISGIITNSKANKNQILAERPKRTEIPNIEVIYQGLHLERYKRINGQKKLHENGEVLRIGIYSGYHYQENYCFEILQHLKNELNTDNIKFMIYQDKLSPEFRKFLRKNELQKFVSFDLMDINFRKFLSYVDVFLSTVNANAFNYQLLYAMVMGKPVIAVDEGSNSEIVEHGGNGYLIDKNDFKALKRIIEKLKDEELRKDLGKESMKIVKEKFNFEQSVDHIEALL